MSAERFSRLRSAFSGVGQRSDVVVIGLGRFGSTVAVELQRLGHHVLGVDLDEELVAKYRDRLSDVRVSDTTSEETLKELGASEFPVAVVAIGNDVEASILTAASLVDLEVPTIWARAITVQHERILHRILHRPDEDSFSFHVVQPDRDEAIRVAHRVAVEDIEMYLDLGDNFVIVEVEAPEELYGKTLLEAGVRNRYDVTIVCIKPKDGRFTHTTADTMVQAGDLLVVAGNTEAAEAFARLP